MGDGRAQMACKYHISLLIFAKHSVLMHKREHQACLLLQILKLFEDAMLKLQAQAPKHLTEVIMGNEKYAQQLKLFVGLGVMRFLQ